MRRLSILALATAMAASTAVAAAAARQGSPEDRTFHVRLERGACFGTCPVYSVDVAADGAVIFRGRKFVTCVGEHRWRISSGSVRRLMAAADRANLFALRDEYRGRMTDMPEFRLEVTRHGLTKRLVDYAGGSAGMPATVTDLEQAVDEIAGTRACATRSRR